MTEKFKILAKYIKDMSSETPDIETFLFVKDNISKYQLNIDITSKALKNKLIEVNTTLKFEDKEINEKKSYYEIVYATIIKIDDVVKDKKDLEKIIQEMFKDKKVNNGVVNFIMVKDIGEAFVTDEVDFSVVSNVLDASR